MDLSGDRYIRDIVEMERCSQDMRNYVSQTREQCQQLIEMFENAKAAAIFGGVAGEGFTDALRAWVKGIQESLPEAEGLSSALDESAAVIIDAENRLKRHLG